MAVVTTGVCVAICQAGLSRAWAFVSLHCIWGVVSEEHLFVLVTQNSPILPHAQQSYLESAGDGRRTGKKESENRKTPLRLSEHLLPTEAFFLVSRFLKTE